MPSSSRLYDAAYRRRRNRLVAWALSNPNHPDCRCWQCKEPLATCGPNRNGRHANGAPAKWTGGHVRDGDRTSPLALECSPCNFRRGASAGNARRPSRRRPQ